MKDESKDEEQIQEDAKAKTEFKPKVSKKELLEKIEKADKELKEKYLQEG